MFQEGDSLFPTGPNGVEYSECDYVDTWKAMEEVQKKGLTKSVGISNFNRKQIERLLESATIIPVTNQVCFHHIIKIIFLNVEILCIRSNVTRI